MKNYIPPYQITDEILMHVSSISDKIGQITQRNGLEAKPHLRKNNKIRSIHSSLHIENCAPHSRYFSDELGALIF